MNIHPEEFSDYAAITRVCDQDFKRKAEGILVNKLRAMDCFDPRLSLEAELNGKIVGYVLLLPIQVVSETGEYRGLSLGPLAVLPVYQKQGFGSRLINTGHQTALDLGYQFIVLIGHPTYYPRFGYKMAASWGLRNPWGIQNEAFMVIELVEGALDQVSGLIVYPEPFNEVS